MERIARDRQVDPVEKVDQHAKGKQESDSPSSTRHD
jgi:hypothetical protein